MKFLNDILPKLVRRVGLLLAAALSLVLIQPAQAVIGAGDNVPAATLLLPHFEVDLNSDTGPQTSVRLSNASASAVLAHVTLWTDWGIPTRSFMLYLTGYDTSEIDLRLVFKGHLPRTASVGQDPEPADQISPQGLLSQDINFASCNGMLPYTTLLPAADVTALRNAHTGVASTTFGGACGGKNYGDGRARGYVTINTTSQCTAVHPTSAGYFINGGSGIATNQNVLIGTSTAIDRSQGTASSEPLVHIEASSTNPISSTSGEPTFYGSLLGNSAADNREPLGTVWNARYLNGGSFTGGTRFTVWQDPGQVVTPAACGTTPAPFPLSLGEVIAFDEQEQAAVSPAIDSRPVSSAAGAFSVVSQKISTVPLTPFSFGHMILNFNQFTGQTSNSSGAISARRQAFVSVDHRATGRFSTSTGAVRLNSADQPLDSQPRYRF
jgi:hypothetical protein